MASIINATTTNGVAVQGDNSGSLQLQTNNGTTAVTIDTSQRVLIGATSASGFDSGADDLVVGGGSGSTGMTIYSGTTGVGSINFADGNTGSAIYAGGMNYNHSTNRLSFYTNDGTGQMYVTSGGEFQMNSGYGSVATAYGCRAWVNFNGTTSPGTIRASGNVTSVTKNGTGDYTVNFTNSMPDANYAVAGTCVGSTTNAFSLVCGAGGSVINTGSVRFGIIAASTGTQQDYTFISISIFR